MPVLDAVLPIIYFHGIQIIFDIILLPGLGVFLMTTVESPTGRLSRYGLCSTGYNFWCERSHVPGTAAAFTFHPCLTLSAVQVPMPVPQCCASTHACRSVSAKSRHEFLQEVPHL
jgi:hypothetical protein